MPLIASSQVVALQVTADSTYSEVRQGATTHGIHCNYHVFHHPEIAGLIELCYDLLKLKYSASWLEISSRDGTMSSKRLYAL